MIESLEQELQNIAETIKAITNVDVTIVNKRLQRIAGTGIFKDEIGKFVPKNSVFHKSIIFNKQYFITNPTKDSLCEDCYSKATCREKAELCIPIKIDNKIIGILGMCIFDDKTKQSFIDKQESYKDFESRLSDLISTRVNEKKLGVIVEYRSSQLLTLINSINEGIMILNNNQKIITTNKYINQKLNITNNKELYINNILPENILNKIVSENFNSEVGPVNINGYKFIINSCPIMVKNTQQGVVLVFSDFDKMQKSVLKAVDSSNIVTFNSIVGESESILFAKRQAMQIAQKDISVLLLGESGTGKEVFARAIHYASNRQNDVFMPINCGAIPENLIESELFGYEKGAFTGAHITGKLGKFEIAKNGTLFLDEIGDLPYHMQVKLLRALEEKEITRVGGYKNLKVNPRIISATHKNLQNLVMNHKFREDLFYRLNVVPINIPPLRDRGYDIIILAKYFLNKYNKVYEKKILGFTSECEHFLLNYHFPGNIRELRNLIEYAVNFEQNNYIGSGTLNQKLCISITEKSNLPLSEMTKLYEKKVIKDNLNQLGYDVEAKKKIAKKLGISIATLYRKIDE